MSSVHEQTKEKMMIENNIREFLAAARAYLLGLVPNTPESGMQLATIPVRRQ
ncbi:hypothetical protein [Azonexus hydrophilus]|jgi:hypothetical protein|uniref:Uncharacterized protein n=1 Tax=Azonexus hydrophilus TaxID=418702 RepID=A0ABZ2XEP4_9RHOO|nr:hypothetical protein [Azonexus hydrophilus]MBS4020447.1 hypothetical protein [Dechloromonas sp.]